MKNKLIALAQYMRESKIQSFLVIATWKGFSHEPHKEAAEYAFERYTKCNHDYSHLRQDEYLIAKINFVESLIKKMK